MKVIKKSYETQQEHSLIITGVNEEDSNVVQGEQITPEELKTLALLIKKAANQEKLFIDDNKGNSFLACWIDFDDLDNEIYIRIEND